MNPSNQGLEHGPAGRPTDGPPLPPGALGLIETDRFCVACGYNLRLQPVTRDDRLGLLVCRCPECGAWDSARDATSPWRTWGSRLALLGGIVWVLFALNVVGWTFAGLVATQVAAGTELTAWRYETPEGAPLTEQQIDAFQEEFDLWRRTQQTAGQPAANAPALRTVVGKPVLVEWLGGPPPPSNDQYFLRSSTSALEAAFAAGFFALCTALAGAIFAAGSWWWGRARQYWWLALPTLAAALAVFINVVVDERRSYTYSGVQWHYANGPALRAALTLAAFVLQTACFAIGLRWGRPFLRLMLRLFCPPGIRQHFAFLWQCDGLSMKKPVAARSTADVSPA